MRTERVSALATGKPKVAIQLQPNSRMKITGDTSNMLSSPRRVPFRTSFLRASLGRAALTAASRSGVNGESIFIAARPSDFDWLGGGS